MVGVDGARTTCTCIRRYKREAFTQQIQNRNILICLKGIHKRNFRACVWCTLINLHLVLREEPPPGLPELQVLGGGDEEEAGVVEVGGEEGEHGGQLSDHHVCRFASPKKEVISSYNPDL